jgi:hypothetical protein
MIQNETAIGRFFQLFAQQSSNNDFCSQASLFADSFLSASPQGTLCVRGSDFASTLPKRKQLFERLGCRPATLVSLQETPLDARYVLAKTSWRLEFACGEADTKEVFVDSTFLVDTGEKAFKIVLYLTHQDIMQVLRDRGILEP